MFNIPRCTRLTNLTATLTEVSESPLADMMNDQLLYNNCYYCSPTTGHESGTLSGLDTLHMLTTKGCLEEEAYTCTRDIHCTHFRKEIFTIRH